MPAQKQIPSQKLSSGTLQLQVQMQSLSENASFWRALLVFFGSLFLLSAFPFYPLPVIFVLAIATGAIAYFAPTLGAISPPALGTIASVLLAFPTVVYQSPIFGWLYLLVIAAVLFQVDVAWEIISFLSIAVLAPFAPFPISLFGGFVMLAMALAALREGSARSIYISLPAVFLILLFSSVWVVQNNAFMPITLGNYQRIDVLLKDAKDVPMLADMPQAAANGFVAMFSMDNVQNFYAAMGGVAENILKLVASDSAIIQLATWALILFLIGWLPGQKFLARNKHKQLIVSLALLLVPIENFALNHLYGVPFDLLVIPYAIASIAVIGLLEKSGITITREFQIERQKKSGQEAMSAESLENIGGYDDIKAELREAIITPIENKALSYKYNIEPARGILLFGPPGTGKTMIIRALANEIHYTPIFIKCSDLLSEWYGQSEKKLTETFADARKKAPCILFFDEIDTIGKSRENYTTDDVMSRIVSLFLQELDGTKKMKNVVVVGTTNIPDQLDHALLRPGRFDKIIYMHLPDKDAREEIFKVHCKKIPIADDVDFKKLAKVTERYSGADIKNICTEATRAAAREALQSGDVVPIRMKHFLDILESIRPSVGIEQLETYEQFRLDFERRAGQKKEKEVKEDAVRWADVAGLDGVKQALLEAIEIPLLHEDLMKQLKVKPSKGLLLFGPPGCGKTMIVKAAANELKATFLSVSGADIMKKGYDYGVGMMKETFNRAREQAPALVFIDEIESLAPERSAQSSPILTQLLTELDGVKELKNVMFIGATNKPSMIDPALMRPGRFDKIVYIPQPDFESRNKVFELNLASVMNDKLDIAELAEVTEGFSGADIASVCQEAKMQVVREKIKGADKFLVTKDIMKVIKARRPSITAPMLQEFAEFMEQYGERK